VTQVTRPNRMEDQSVKVNMSMLRPSWASVDSGVVGCLAGVRCRVGCHVLACDHSNGRVGRAGGGRFCWKPPL